ncbi:MAG TPA: membrane protein insertion efficiency factor YidD [Candidatus Omnitrophota bacterium]|nr:membrane protein insertion efficiency factor YidD [Candidatus Omnitrophota bacterium]HSA30361.1 membrane protein insertion efficiency factor YidD [Candidatus Omnitrophota bacterium]
MSRSLVCFFIQSYQKISRLYMPRTCRFYPSCSSYALEAVERFGVLKGAQKAVIRILRCNPFFKGGYDPLKD